MGSTQSKPSRPRSRERATSFKPYTGPKEFRASVMPVRTPNRQAAHEPYTSPENCRDNAMPEQRPSRQAAHMYQSYRDQEQRRNVREGNRYSWEGHSSEKAFTTFESMAARGVIPKSALEKKSAC